MATPSGILSHIAQLHLNSVKGLAPTSVAAGRPRARPKARPFRIQKPTETSPNTGPNTPQASKGLRDIEKRVLQLIDSDKESDNKKSFEKILQRYPEAIDVPIDHPNPEGWIDKDGKFRCACGNGSILNKALTIAIHIGQHKKRARDPRVCAQCKKTCICFKAFKSHILDAHSYSGPSKKIWEAWCNGKEDLFGFA
ncbi:hypothetical protein F4677DRAFT_441817 [Hypoxylon crocopeplum]|nr:hypothetical protein F4677DRAFT_441817 [Hypoxylon crocopeplum]